MLTINLDFHGKARVWLDDNFSLLYPVIDITTQVIQTGLTQKFNKKQAVLELFVPVGARINYGLLGVEFIPDHSGKLTVEVWLSTENEALFEQSLTGQLDRVRVGLPVEYHQSVIKGLKLTLNAQLIETLGSGILRFNQAAHGEVGSSNQFFQKISMLIIQLLLLDYTTPQTKVTEIIKNCSLLEL